MIGLVPLALLWLLPLMGMAAYIAAHHLGLWMGNRREGLHLWAFGWCANTLCYLGSRAIQVVSHSPEQAALAGRLAWVSGIVLVPLVVGLSYALAGRRLPQYLMRGVIGLTAVLLSVLCSTQAIVTGRVYVRTDWPGFQYSAPVPGPLMPVLVPYFLLVFGYCFRAVWLSTALAARERRIVLTAFVLYIFCALNDVLYVSRIIHTIRLFDLAFVAVGVGLTYLMVRRSNRLHTRLEDEVSARTVELRLQRDELTRANQALDEQTRELTALHEVRTALASTLRKQSVLETIAEWAIRLTGADGSAVFELDPAEELMHRRAARGARVNGLASSLRLGQGAAGIAACERRPIWSRDLQSEPRPGTEDELLEGRSFSEVGRAHPYRAILGVPFDHHEVVLGSICLYWSEIHNPTAREIRLLNDFGQLAAVALDQGRLYEALEGRVASLEALTKLNKLISSPLDRDEVLRAITEAATRLMKVPVALLCVADENRRSLDVIAFSDPAAGADFPLRTIAFDQGILGWIASHRQPVNVPDIFHDDRFVAFEWWRARGLRSFYGVPVVLDGAVLAVLALDGTQPFHFLPEERDLLDSFVAQAAVAIRNASMYRAEGEARAAAEAALADVKQLQGLLPICSYCKKIRDDRNYWERIETYITERSEVAFSHGICPECHDTIVAPQLEQWRQTLDADSGRRDVNVVGERPVR